MCKAKAIITIMIFYIGVFLLAYWYAKLPLVKLNGITGECIDVIGGDYTCDDLPEKYIPYKVLIP